MFAVYGMSFHLAARVGRASFLAECTPGHAGVPQSTPGVPRGHPWGVPRGTLSGTASAKECNRRGWREVTFESMTEAFCTSFQADAV